jgi:NADH-quinone oxidoreductase subunit I
MAVEKGYFGQIAETTSSVFEGLSLTLKHLFAARQSRKQQFVQAANYFNHDTEAGIVTLQYPAFKLPVPAIGRYELDCVIEDCIVCDKCAKICPVNCIDIVGIKAPEVIGETSDGTNKRIHAAKFDIDMAKCCFCGLCTTVCPTECLTMTNEYDHTTFTVDEMNFSFASMSIAEIAQAQANLEADKLAKETAKAALAAKQAEVIPVSEAQETIVTAKPKFSAFKKKEPLAEATESIEVRNEPTAPVELDEVPKPKATFKPFKKKEEELISSIEPEITQIIPVSNPISEADLPNQEEAPKPKAAFKPFKKKENTNTTENPNSDI